MKNLRSPRLKPEVGNEWVSQRASEWKLKPCTEAKLHVILVHSMHSQCKCHDNHINIRFSACFAIFHMFVSMSVANPRSISHHTLTAEWVNEQGHMQSSYLCWQAECEWHDKGFSLVALEIQVTLIYWEKRRNWEEDDRCVCGGWWWNSKE